MIFYSDGTSGGLTKVEPFFRPRPDLDINPVRPDPFQSRPGRTWPNSTSAHIRPRPCKIRPIFDLFKLAFLRWIKAILHLKFSTRSIDRSKIRPGRGQIWVESKWSKVEKSRVAKVEGRVEVSRGPGQVEKVIWLRSNAITNKSVTSI